MIDLSLDSRPLSTDAFGPTALFVLLFAVGTPLLVATPRPAFGQPQDTMQVAGTTLTSSDSAAARRLLRTDLSPTSRHWTKIRESEGHGGVAKTVFRVTRLAYPADIRADSMLAFFRDAGTRHPDPSMRAEFLFGGLQLAASAERKEAQEQLYQRLVSDHEGSHYAEQARRLYAPGSQIEAGNPLPSFQLPKLSDSTATFAKSDFEGRTVLIDFWGTWCGPCIQAMPHLHEAYRKHGGRTLPSSASRCGTPGRPSTPSGPRSGRCRGTTPSCRRGATCRRRSGAGLILRGFRPPSWSVRRGRFFRSAAGSGAGRRSSRRSGRP